MTRFQGFFLVTFGLLCGCGYADASGASSSDAAGAGGASATSGAATSGGVGGGDGGTTDNGAGGGAGAVCDDLGACGDYKNGCGGCVVEGVCAAPYQACSNDQRCASYNKCLVGCQNDLNCQKACADQNPTGAKLYSDLVTCVACTGCPKSCSSLSSLCK
jgi:hypothetical protein